MYRDSVLTLELKLNLGQNRTSIPYILNNMFEISKRRGLSPKYNSKYMHFISLDTFLI
jgi:hypothetical protein